MNWLFKLDRTTRLGLLSIVLGVVGALGAQLFLWMLATAQSLILQPISGYTDVTIKAASGMSHIPLPSHWLWLVPVATTLGGLIVGLLVYTLAPEAQGHGTDAAVDAFHRTKGFVRPRILFVKSVASAITIGSGGSAGREGPTAQISASAGSIIAGLLRLPADERRLIVLIGMAAGLSAIFKSPLGTAIFAVEILYSTMAFEGSALVFTLIGASVAYAVTGLFDGWTPLFMLPNDVGFSHIENLLWYAVLAVLAGVLGAALPTMFYTVRDAFARLSIPKHFKPAIGGLAVGLIGIFAPPLLGGGYGYMQFALQGGAGMAIWYMLLLSVGKIVALSLTIGSGGSGGVFGPSLYVGAMLGAAIAATLIHFGVSDIRSTGMAVVGMAAVFAGAARVPVASLVMVAEMTGDYKLIMPAMFAVAISYLVQMQLTRNARYPTLYEDQVPAPENSPVHYETYYRVVANLLRDRKVKLEKDIFINQLKESLSEGDAIPISTRGGDECLYTLELPSHTRIHGQQVRHLGLQDVLIVSVLRGNKEIIPIGSTQVCGGDRLVVAARPEAMKKFVRQATMVSTGTQTADANTTDSGSKD